MSIEKNKILTYPHNFLNTDNSNTLIPNEIHIKFVDNVNQPNKENIYEHYNISTGEIVITENILFQTSYLPVDFPQHLNEKVGQQKLLLFAILHEIGHAVHHQTFLYQNNSYLNSENENHIHQFFYIIAKNTIHSLGNGSENEQLTSKPYVLNRTVLFSLTEGFADLYACIGISELYDKKVAVAFIEDVIYSRANSNDFYYTTNTMKIFLNDFKEGNFNIKNFDDMLKYVQDNTFNTVLKGVIQKLSEPTNDNSITNKLQIQHNNAF